MHRSSARDGPRGVRAAAQLGVERLPFLVGVELRYTFGVYETKLEAIGRTMPLTVTESHPQYIDEVHVANWHKAAWAHWLADPRVIAATPMFWNHDQNRFWLYAVAGDGAAVALSPTYRRLRGWPKLAGSPQLRSAMENGVSPQRLSSGAASSDGMPADGVAPGP